MKKAFSPFRTVGELSKVEGSAQSHLAFRGLSCWEALVTLYLWFRFLTWSMIAICSRFCSPGGGGGLCSCGNYGFFLAWDGPFKAVGGFMDCD